MRRAAIVVLSVLAGLLATLPLAFAAYLSALCMNPTGGPCRTVTLHDWLMGELASIWMPPFVVAMLLVGGVLYLKRTL